MKLRVFIAVISILCLAYACGEDRDLIPDQRTAIESYMSGRGMSDYEFNDGVYKYVANKSRASYPTDPVAAVDDSIYFMFEAYPFTSAPQTLYYTNKMYLVANDTILNRQYWSFDPLGVRVGHTKLIAGLANSLPGCRQGDSVVLVMTSDMAYKDHHAGLVPENSAVMMVLNIKNVKK